MVYIDTEIKITILNDYLINRRWSMISTVENLELNFFDKIFFTIIIIILQ